MSYEPYKDYRLAPDDTGCWDVLDENYEPQGTYPSKAAAKRAIDDLSAPVEPEQTLDSFMQKLGYTLKDAIKDHKPIKRYEYKDASYQNISVPLARKLQAFVDKTVEAKTIDRFEVIDDTGRAYVKGSIYGTPVSIELSYQDSGKTLKVFVKEKG